MCRAFAPVEFGWMKRRATPGRSQLVKLVRELKKKVADAAIRHSRRLRDWRRDQAALRDSEACLRAILETALEGIITINERGIIESINPAGEGIFGYRSAELIGKNVSRLMPSPFRESHDRYIENYVRGGRPKIIGIGREVVGRRKNGSVFPMDLSVSEIRLADRRIFAGFVRDITSRKSLEQEILDTSENEQRRIGQDLHDGLGQQLTGIELMCQVLQQRLESTRPGEASRVKEISGHVRETIAFTRNLARGLAPLDLDAAGLMTALEELSARAGRMFSIKCEFRCQRTVLVAEKSVSAHLFRIAQEAVTNAVRHGHARSIEIRLEDSPRHIALSVIDDGTGFSRKRTKSGGMGLRIMRYRAAMMGGSLEIHPNSSRGVTVSCAVPRHGWKGES